MSMAVFNRPSAGKCPLCGAKMYYKQTPIMLEYSYEKYDVWASVKYCDECGFQIMVPGEAKIAKHDSRHVVEEQIRKAEQAAKAKARAEMQKPKVHAFNPKNEGNPEPEHSKEKKILPPFKQDKNNKNRESRPDVPAMVAANQLTASKPQEGKPQPQKKQPELQAPAGKTQPNALQKAAQTKEQRQMKPVQPQQQPQQRPQQCAQDHPQQRPQENSKTPQGNKRDPKNNTQPYKGIPEAIRNRLPIGQTKPGELPGTMGRFGLSDFQLTASAAQNISNLLDMTEERDKKKTEKQGDQKVLSAKNVDELIFAEEMETSPQINRKNKKEQSRTEKTEKQQPATPANAQRNTEKQSQAGNKPQNIQNPGRPQNVTAQNSNLTKSNKPQQTAQKPQVQKQDQIKKPQPTEPQKAIKPQVSPIQQQKQALEPAVKTTEEKPKDEASVTTTASQGDVAKNEGSSAAVPSKPIENKKPQPMKEQKETAAQNAGSEQAGKPDEQTTKQPPKAQGGQQSIPRQTEKQAEPPAPKPDKAQAKPDIPEEKPEAAEQADEKQTENKPVVKETAQTVKDDAQAHVAEKQAQPNQPNATNNVAAPDKGAKTTDSAKPSSEAADKEPETHEADNHKGNKNYDFTNLKKSVAKHLPKWVVSRIPFLADTSDDYVNVPIAIEKDFVKKCEPPHRREIIDNLLYDTDNSDMFLKKSGSYGFDRPCVHYNYCSPNGHFFRCSVRYDKKNKDGYVELRPMDAEMEVKPMLRNYPELYKKFFESDLHDA